MTIVAMPSTAQSPKMRRMESKWAPVQASRAIPNGLPQLSLSKQEMGAVCQSIIGREE